jgi:hypothetical protein
MQEVELEDGKISWMPGVVIDKSRAIGLCDELNDDQKKACHWLVFLDKPLLGFLTKGAHEHFLVNAHTSELDTVEQIEWDDDFLEWLGGIFAPQFDRVLTKAIDQGNAVIVECLLDGRRWVPAYMVDDCFRNALRAVEKLLRPLKEMTESADQTKPTLSSVKAALEQGRMLEIMNLLPVFFEKQQNDAVHSVRGLAVKAFNVHDDIDLSRQIIELAKRFKFRSADVNKSIEEDVEAIEELIRKERIHQVKINIGNLRWEITKEGVRLGNRFIPADEVSSIRWGILVTRTNNGNTGDFLVGFCGQDDQTIVFQWNSNPWNFDKEEAFFNKLIGAAMNYVLPSLLKRVEASITRGDAVNIGPCRLTKEGVNYGVKGWIFTSEHFVPWSRVSVSVENGELIIVDQNEPKKLVSLSLRNTDNAILLRIFAKNRNRIGG